MMSGLASPSALNSPAHLPTHDSIPGFLKQAVEKLIITFNFRLVNNEFQRFEFVISKRLSGLRASILGMRF